MKFFNLDLHASVIEDIQDIFNNLGHGVYSYNMSGHCHVFNKQRSPPLIINGNNWCKLNKDVCDQFYEKYKDMLEDYDGFIVTYPPSFALLFEKFNKPIIVHVPIRYEVPFQNDLMKWKWFNDFLIRGIDEKRIFIVANSIYDKEYCEFFLERECQYITSLCEYKGSYPKWTGDSDNFLIFNKSSLRIGSKNIIGRPASYNWKDLENYKGIIHIPYNISTMSIYEQYTANTPLFFPSIDFLFELMSKGIDALSEITWNQIFGMQPTNGINPNNYKDLVNMKTRVTDAEFYNQSSMPFIVYFNSFEDLKEKLTSTNLIEVSNKMNKFNVIRKQKIYDQWKHFLKRVESSLD